MDRFALVNWLSVIVAAASGFVIGALWYGPLFGKAWMRLSGMTKEKGAETSMALTFGTAYVLNFIAATGIATVSGDRAGIWFALHTGLLGAVFFIAPALGVIHLFEQRPLRLWLINAGYQVLNFAAMGAIIGAWPR
ncbi:MAG TPA: DUF1761 domain-containing protein [Steroidobacteraceae bacterium]|nr:DUF1761 domain-containing protein [Steroidobacteraceae bacterium]